VQNLVQVKSWAFLWVMKFDFHKEGVVSLNIWVTTRISSSTPPYEVSIPQSTRVCLVVELHKSKFPYLEYFYRHAECYEMSCDVRNRPSDHAICGWPYKNAWSQRVMGWLVRLSICLYVISNPKLISEILCNLVTCLRSNFVCGTYFGMS
jgi:hypothetical protein